MPSLDDQHFWMKAKDPKTVHTEGSLRFMVLPASARMSVIHRTKEELFETTVKNAMANSRFTCAINGLQYSVSQLGLADALMGGDPVAANHTSADGLIFQRGARIGRSAPRMFYIADNGR